MYYNRECAMYIPSLEAKLAENPKSPVFARLAFYYLKEGKIQQALQVCLKGLEFFTDYATGHLVLGQCYEVLGRNIEAMLEYRKGLRSVPDNPTAQALLKGVERREQEAFEVFAEERARKLKEQKDSLTFEQFVSAHSSEKESTVDFLLKQLQEVKKGTASSQGGDDPKSKEKAVAAPGGTSKIVTVTLAEIYANQGEYREAIDAYEKLLKERPVEAGRYEKRIAQLEELTRLQQAESK